jgi:hypothetical protein
VKFGCMTCGAKYSVPDGRLDAAGAQGLRIRCSRCRAIMVVSGATAAASSADDDTKKELPVKRRSPPTISTDSLQVAGTSGGVDAPAALSASGIFRPMPGVHRQVTGLFFAELEAMDAPGSSGARRVWYAAIDARPRGPFSATEMIALAEKGKIRESTLIWRPGFKTWLQVKSELSDDLSWLKKIVGARKLREREAQQRAEQRLGIKPVSLTRTSSGKKSGYKSGAPGMPPPLPEDAEDENPALTSGSFAWRAEEMPSLDRGRAPTVVRRRQRSTLALLGVVAIVVGVAAAGITASKLHVVERAAHLIGP